MLNHSSSHATLSLAKRESLVSPSNYSQNLHVKRLETSNSFEMLPITPPMIPEEYGELPLFQKCASVQTTDDEMKENDLTNDTEDISNVSCAKVDKTQCRCPNCTCENCLIEPHGTDSEKNNVDAFQDIDDVVDADDDDDDSGTESCTNEELIRQLSVSSVSKSSASVLIHSC